MKIAAVVILALLLPAASAQRVDSEASDGWLGDEPGVTQPGSIEVAGDDPSSSYPADDNGVVAARAGEGSLVLGVRFHARAAVFGTPVDSGPVDFGGAFARLAGGDGLLAGTGQFQAWHGTWADDDGDDWIDTALPSDRVHVNARGDCEPGVRTADADGLGSAQGVPTGLSVRCATGAEWVPRNDAVIVAYFTPGRPSDIIHRVFLPEGDDPRTPDFTFVHRSVEGRPTGRYYSPTTDLEYLIVDGSVLQSTVVEAISDPVFTADGKRTHERSEASRVEVDVYRAIDPTVEALYRDLVAVPADDAGCDLDYPERGCPATTGPLTSAITDAVASTDPVVGPVKAAVLAPHGPEDPARYLDGPRPYLDLYLGQSTGVDAGTMHVLLSRDVYDVAPLGDGRARPVGQVDLLGHFGLWHDVNADGWIGAPSASPGCPDAHDCGMTQDPGVYTLEGSGGEFTPGCARPDEGAGPAALSPLWATLTTASGTWGTGVYVISDRKDATDANADAYRDRGAGYQPYDDAVLDAADGDVDVLVASGPVQVHLLCRDAGGQYVSYERLVFTGPMVEDVTTFVDAVSDFSVDGIPLDETVSDTDVYPGWRP